MNIEKIFKSFVEKKAIKDFKIIGHLEKTFVKITWLNGFSSVFDFDGEIIINSSVAKKDENVEDIDHEIVNGRDCDGTPYN